MTLPHPVLSLSHTHTHTHIHTLSHMRSITQNIVTLPPPMSHTHTHTPTHTHHAHSQTHSHTITHTEGTHHYCRHCCPSWHNCYRNCYRSWHHCCCRQQTPHTICASPVIWPSMRASECMSERPSASANSANSKRPSLALWLPGQRELRGKRGGEHPDVVWRPGA